MSEYRIETMADFLALTKEQRERCVVDMLAWADFVDVVRSEMRGIFETPDAMTWVDDERIGEISAVRIVGPEA